MNKNIAITVGVFDCLHEGHVNLLMQMCDAAPRTIVLLHDDYSTFQNKNRFPVQAMEHRYQNLMKSRLVDNVHFVYAPDPTVALTELIEAYGVDPKEAIYMRGDDWQDFPGRKKVEELGIEISFVPYTPGVSTTLIRKELQS